ncbi:MAG: RAMP superfamily CRISPR-associated protein [Methylocella sp.]
MSRFSLFARRIEIGGTLEVISPLHVGSGVEVIDEAIELSEEERRRLGISHPMNARVQRDAIGRPYIPGCSIKGALRAIAEDAAATDAAATAKVEALFGVIKNNGKGTMGALTIFGAIFGCAGRGDDLPFFDKKRNGESDNSAGLFISARTAIDHGRGTAKHSKLFHAEEVAAGTTFSLRARYLPPVDEE